MQGALARCFCLLMAVTLLLGLQGCSDSSVGSFPSGPQAPGEDVGSSESRALAVQSGEVLDGVLQLARQSVTIPFPGGSVSVSYSNGWWSVRVVMFGSDRSLRLRFEDEQGNAMQYYHPHNTRIIQIQSTTENSRGLLAFGLHIDGVELDAPNFRVYANGRYENRDQTWFFYVNRLLLAKSGNPYPLAGDATLEVPHDTGNLTSVDFLFNGSRVVDGRLTSGDVTASFTLDLVTLQVEGI